MLSVKGDEEQARDETGCTRRKIRYRRSRTRDGSKLSKLVISLTSTSPRQHTPTHRVRSHRPRKQSDQPCPERTEHMPGHDRLVDTRVLVLVQTLELGFGDPHGGTSDERSDERGELKGSRGADGEPEGSWRRDVEEEEKKWDGRENVGRGVVDVAFQRRPPDDETTGKLQAPSAEHGTK